MSEETLSAQHGDEPAARRSPGESEVPVLALPRRVGVHVVGVVRTRRLRRLTDWLSAVVASHGVSERFAAERQRDRELVRRVERRRRL